ncbi:FtsX-like permease family protein [Solwaraspora sp. WMMA2101]|uniref:FtsX-like permease family protein n=1 Tax=Solwaraspora sp. WMMA2101 TaxID=3404124 RepID=UPI003B950ADA
MTGPRSTRLRYTRQRGGGLGRLGYDVAFGARLAFSGGRDGWTRAIFTAVGVGIGVAMLLLAASVPGALAAREERGAARAGGYIQDSTGDALLFAYSDTIFRNQGVWGRTIAAEGPQAPVPPGVAALPGPGEAVVSPALAELLAGPDGALLAPRIGERIVGQIGPEGLTGPAELAFYRGSTDLDPELSNRVTAFGGGGPNEVLGPVLTLLVVIIFVVLLLPIVVFLGAAVRFGGAARDRRLAALRLAGADHRMIGRFAAGEALTGALLGLIVGAALFLIGRQITPLVQVSDLSVFAADVRPPAVLVALAVVAAPLAAVAVGLIALRGVVAEPLGVVRRATPRRRRPGWRLAVPLAGLALLYPLLRGGISSFDALAQYQVAAGAVLMLIGVVTLLPWLIETTVRRMRGGPVAWQLAVRRLQVDGAGNARLVSGVAVAVAGTIALQGLFIGIEDDFTRSTGADPTRASHSLYVGSPTGGQADRLLARVAEVPGVESVRGFRTTGVTAGSGDVQVWDQLTVADCAVLADLIAVTDCADGDVFLVTPPDAAVRAGTAPPAPVAATTRPGDRLQVGEDQYGWTLPPTVRTAEPRVDPWGGQLRGIFATTGAIDPTVPGPMTIQAYLTIDPTVPDAVERVRNLAATAGVNGQVSALSTNEQARQYVNIRRGLTVGIVVTLLLIGASLLVSTLEQLRERRRLLAMLAAFGTPRRVLGWAVLWQQLVPVLIGTALAVVAGLGLGAVLLGMVGRSLAFSWWSVAGASALGAGAAIGVTVASLPVLWRLMRADGLRTE